MSKVQDAINASRDHAKSAGHMHRSGSFTKATLRPRAAPTRLEGRPSLALDPKRMESNCLLPFVKAKAATNAYMLLRTRLMQRMRDNQWKSLMVTGTLPNDGKTTTAINVAIGVSQDVSQAVLLVDLDLARPMVAASLGLKRGKGLSDYLRGEADAEHILYNTDVDRLFVLPNFEGTQSSESLISLKMLALLDHIKRLDPNLLIIFDMPPILSSDSVLAIAPHVDALLLVISEGQTSRSLLKRANQMIEEIPRAGIVLNRSSEGDTGGYY